MSYEVELGTGVIKAMRSIPANDQPRIKTAMYALRDDPRPPGAVKMKDDSGWRIRVGDWRIAYVINDGIRVVTITRVRNRRDATARSTMDRLFTITEAKTHLSDILRHVDNQPAVIVRYSRPVGVIVSPSTLNALYEEIEELKDMLSIHEHDPNEPGVPLDKAMIELGWS